MKAKKTTKATTQDASARQVATATMMASVNAAAVISEYGKAFGEQDISLLVEDLCAKVEAVNAGDLHHCEAMLLGQAQALQTIFVNLARRAANQDYLKQCETFLRLALKAQNQSRMTLETLAAIKNPPVVFAKQANINQGSGNQQVNNGAPAPDNRSNTHAPARGKTEIQPNELLTAGARNGETVDGGTTAAAIPADTHLETVGAINRG